MTMDSDTTEVESEVEVLHENMVPLRRFHGWGDSDAITQAIEAEITALNASPGASDLSAATGAADTAAPMDVSAGEPPQTVFA